MHVLSNDVTCQLWWDSNPQPSDYKALLQICASTIMASFMYILYKALLHELSREW